MRKHDFLRRIYNKALKVGDDLIYHVDIPDAFYKKGDQGCFAQPFGDKFGLAGVAVEHNYQDSDCNWCSYTEIFKMRKVVSL